MAEIFTRRQIVNAALGGAAATLWNGTARATLPILPPMPLDEYINKNGQLIFTGYFNRVLSITHELRVKLFDPEAKIDPNELRTSEISKNPDSGSVFFFEITNVNLVLINQRNVSLEYIKECKFKIIYCSGFNVNSMSVVGKYYRGMVKKNIVMFLTPRMHYGVNNSTKFLEPHFSHTAGAEWPDSVPFRHISELERIASMAKHAGYIEPPRNICAKNI